VLFRLDLKGQKRPPLDPGQLHQEDSVPCTPKPRSLYRKGTPGRQLRRSTGEETRVLTMNLLKRESTCWGGGKMEPLKVGVPAGLKEKNYSFRKSNVSGLRNFTS
jgi:hypothetical protein